MFETKDYSAYKIPSQLIEFAYPGKYDYEFLKKADEIKMTIDTLKTGNGARQLYSVCDYYDPSLKSDKKEVANILIDMVRKRIRQEQGVPF